MNRGGGSWAEERGGEGGGCYSSRMEMGEEAVFTTAGFRVREAGARGSRRRVDADRDDARRPGASGRTTGRRRPRIEPQLRHQ